MDEILPWLPVKSLSRFKCVSKPWQSLIESDRFIEIQYRNSAKNPRVIMSKSNKQGGVTKGCSLHSLLKSGKGSDPRKKEAWACAFVGCCNGVVCCYDPRDRRFLLWNPAIRVSIELPYSGGYGVIKCGFGWDESSGAYKVFVALYDRKRNKLVGKIYSSNTKSWGTIPFGSLSLFSASGLFLHGNLHWVIDGRHSLIECFDLEREEFGRIELPLENAAKVTSYFPLLGEIGRRLSILVDLKKSLEVWVLKEYGVNDSWFKLLTFPAGSRPRNFGCFRLFGEGPNGDILVCDEENLTVYSPKDNAFSTARNYVDCSRACLDVVSFVSPKRILDATNSIL